jgi:hypothetical protein
VEAHMKRSVRHSISIVLLAAAAGCQPAPGATSATAEVAAPLDGTSGNAYVNYHRDRLLDAYASYKNLGDRVNAWNSLSPKQRDLFLVQTDLLGNRSFMTNDDVRWVIDPSRRCAGSVYCDGGCSITTGGVNEYCTYVSLQECENEGACSYTIGPRYDYSMALEHVTMMYELLAPNGDCGGEDNNRIFWQADEQLIGDFRNYAYGLPEWDSNGDLGGPHAPFNNASSTLTGRPASCDGPDGQAQFYSYDWQAQWFQRGNAYLPADGRMFELDDDYNTFHDSSPDCSYCGGQYGRTMYEQHWCSKKGNGAACDWGYWPTAVNLQGWHDVSSCQMVAGWAWDANKPDQHISVDIYLDGSWIARVPADQYRGDLQAAGIGDGTHGFSWTPPTIYHDHTFTVKVVNSSFTLSGSPRPSVPACG